MTSSSSSQRANTTSDSGSGGQTRPTLKTSTPRSAIASTVSNQLLLVVTMPMHGFPPPLGKVKAFITGVSHFLTAPAIFRAAAHIDQCAT